ncbi:MAG: prolipoprotein diacylglyceryl transferase [Candidatus Dormibacteria bacterium]
MLSRLLLLAPGFPGPQSYQGIQINIDPVIFRLGSLQITWHGFFTAVGVLAGILLASRLAPLAGISDETVQAVAWWAVVGGIAGARLLYVWETWNNIIPGTSPVERFSTNPLDIILRINEGGLSIMGTVVGGSVGVVLYCMKNRLHVLRVVDLLAAPTILGMAIGRIGDIINGEHHSQYFPNSWFAVRYLNPNTNGEKLFGTGQPTGRPVHLAVGYEMAMDLVIFAGLLWLVRRRFRLGSGTVFALFLLGYGVDRLLVSPFRLDSPWAFGLMQAQIFAIILVVVGAAGLLANLLGARGMIPWPAGGATPAPLADAAPSATEPEPAPAPESEPELAPDSGPDPEPEPELKPKPRTRRSPAAGAPPGRTAAAKPRSPRTPRTNGD